MVAAAVAAAVLCSSSFAAAHSNSRGEGGLGDLDLDARSMLKKVGSMEFPGDTNSDDSSALAHKIRKPAMAFAFSS